MEQFVSTVDITKSLDRFLDQVPMNRDCWVIASLRLQVEDSEMDSLDASELRGIIQRLTPEDTCDMSLPEIYEFVAELLRDYAEKEVQNSDPIYFQVLMNFADDFHTMDDTPSTD